MILFAVVVACLFATTAFALSKVYGRFRDLERRFCRVTQQLAEEQMQQGEHLETIAEVLAEEKKACQALVTESQALVALANERVTHARSAYSEGALLRDNAMRRIEKWDAVTTDFVASIDKWKDKMDRWRAKARSDLDGVMAAHSSSAGALTKRIKKLEEAQCEVSE